MSDLEKETDADKPDQAKALHDSEIDKGEHPQEKESSSIPSTSEGDADESRSNAKFWSLLTWVLCLTAGFGIGWFGHDFQTSRGANAADATNEEKGGPARGPCNEWAEAICGGLGETTYACRHAKITSTLLSGSSCAQAQQGVSTKLEELKATRAPCRDLSGKLCGELGADGQGCELVKTKTPTFSPQDCEKMLKSYDRVLAELKAKQESGAL